MEPASPPIRLRSPLVLAICARLAVVLAGVLAMAVTFPRRNPLVEHRGWDSAAFDTHSLLGHALRLGERWDARWYLSVVDHGYSTGDRNAAFFPLFPLLTKVVALTGLPPWLAATLVSGVAFLGCAVLLDAIVLRLPAGGGERVAGRAVLLWACAPWAVVLGAIYPESLLALLCAGTWLAALTRRPVLAAVLCGLAMLTKPLGVAALPFVWMAAARGDGVPGRQLERRAGAVVGAAAVAMAWPAYLLVTRGDPFLFASAQAGWDRAPHRFGPVSGVLHGIREGAAGLRDVARERLDLSTRAIANLGDPVGIGMQDAVNLGAMAVLVALAIVAWRRLGWAAGASTALCALVPLSLPSGDIPLLSAPRFLLVALPAWVVLAGLLEGARWRLRADVVAAGAAALGGCVASGWATWQWLG